jgi:hypothetical protein
MPPMKTIKIPEAAGWLLRLVLAAWLVALAGCGPGTGGTGTGPEGSFIVGPTSTMAPNGLGTARAECLRDCAEPTLLLEAGKVSLATGCLRFTHAGPWSVGEDGVASIGGTLETTRDGQTQTATGTLRLQFAGAPDDAQTAVTVTLFDGSGNTVLGPQVMNRGESAVPVVPAPCVP